MQIKTCTVIYNPVASRFDNALLIQIVDKLKDHGMDVKVIKSNKAGHVVDLVKKYNPLCDLILTMGGDGTVGEAFQGLYQQKQHALYTHLSTGTTNDVVDNFQLIRNDALGSLDLILDGEVRQIDVLTVNDSPFCYISAFGYVANVPYATPTSFKRNLGYNGYVLYATKEIAKGPRKIQATYTKNGEVIESNILLAIVSNSRRFAGVDIHKDILLDDGLFEVLLVKYVTPKLVAQILRDYLKNAVDFSKYGDCTEIFKTDDFTVCFDNKKRRLDLCNDGDKFKTDRVADLCLHYKANGKISMLLPKPREE